MGMTQAGMTSVELFETYAGPYKERIKALEAFAEYVLKNSGERTIRDKAAEVLGR